MKPSSSRAARQLILIIAVFLFLPSESLFAQEPTLAALTPASSVLGPVSPVETVSTEPVPSAPGGAAPLPEAPMPLNAALAPVTLAPVVVTPKERAPHRFLDRKNQALFAAVASLAAADFYATHANLASGGRELNPMTRIFCGSTPALAANFALETGSVIGISYLFHRSGHHRLERLTAVVNIGTSAAAAGYSFSHH